jgi:hypothetical protein
MCFFTRPTHKRLPGTLQRLCQPVETMSIAVLRRAAARVERLAARPAFDILRDGMVRRHTHIGHKLTKIVSGFAARRQSLATESATRCRAS